MKEILLSQNRYAIVDDEDFERMSQYKWSFSVRYAVRNLERKTTVYMHREILGDIPKGLVIDHINSNGLDNRKCNLRICKDYENAKHNSKMIDCTSRFKGVCWSKRDKRWRARIHNNFKEHWIGLFETEIEAALAYNLKAKELHGEFARLNEVG